MTTGRPAWREVRLPVARKLGEPVYEARPLVPARRSGMTWASRAPGTGLAAFTHEREAYGNSLEDAECAAVSAVLDRLEVTPAA